jgi:hypothetical protein
VKPRAIAIWTAVGAFVLFRAWQISMENSPPMPRIATRESPSASGAEAPEPEESPLSVNGLIRSWCSHVSPDDYRMQRYCVDEERKAADQLGALQEKYLENSDEWKILARCLNRHTYLGGSGVAFRLAKHCSEEELAAYRSLQ